SSLVFISCKKESIKSEIDKPDVHLETEASTLATTVVNVSPSTNFNTAFWSNINSLLNNGYVDIVFADGTYNVTSTLHLNGVGHNTNRLQLKANTIGAAVFTSNVSDSIPDLMQL